MFARVSFFVCVVVVICLLPCLIVFRLRVLGTMAVCGDGGQALRHRDHVRPWLAMMSRSPILNGDGDVSLQMVFGSRSVTVEPE